MPAIYTHYVFSKNIYDKLDKKIIKTFDQERTIYEIFSQSFDFLFFYNYLSLKPGKKIRNLGRYCHRNNTQKYLINIIKYIKTNKLFKQSDVLAYLYGSINHYCLDTTMHPYINYLSYIAKDNISMHTKLEFEIDAYYYEKINNKPFYKYNLPKDILPKIKFSKDLKKCINSVFAKTYNVKNMGCIYEKSYNQSKFIYRLAMIDKLGIKKAIYKIFDLFTIPFGFKCTYCSFFIKKIDTNFLNLKKNTWYNIKDKFTLYTTSWDELYLEAIQKSLNIINLCYEYFYGSTNLSTIKKCIPNISYANGLKI